MSIRSAASSTRSPARALLRNTLLHTFYHWYRERFTPAGRWFLGATAVFALTGASSLELQFYPAFLYAATLWLVASLTSRRRPRVALKARHASRIGAGEMLTVEIEVGSLRRQSELIIAPFRLDKNLELSGEWTVAPLKQGEKARGQIGLQCAQRGVYVLNGWCAESDFPLGLLRTRQHFSSAATLHVTPRFSPLQALDLPFHDARDGVAVASRVGESFEILGNRDWRDGDVRRDIDWRATARSTKTIVREMCQERWPRANIVLDTFVARAPSPLFKRRKTDHRTDDFERAVCLCASVTDWMARQNYVVELFAAGAQILHLDAEPHSTHLDTILDVLAGVESAPTSPFVALAAALSQEHKSAPTTICILLDWDETRRQFIDQLRGNGDWVKVVVVRDGATSLSVETEKELALIDRTQFQSGGNRL